MGVTREPCGRVPYMTTNQAAHAVELALMAAMLRGTHGHEITATFCSECQAIHVTSRAPSDSPPDVEEAG
jgi:hypothetical protein